MGWLDKLFTKKALQRGVSYHVHNGQFINPADNKTAYITDGYSVNDLIYSIVNLISDKVRVAPWAVYKVVDESSLKKAKALMSKKNLTSQDYIRALEYREKALVETKDDKLDALMDTPDGYCTFQDLVANSSVFKLLTGDRMIWAEILDGGANTGKPQSLHILPSDLLTMKVESRWPFKVSGYELTDWGLIRESAIPAELVLHDKYFNPNYTAQGDHLWGLSPLKAALILTTKSNEANKTEAAQFQNQGPKKVIFIDHKELTAQDIATAGTQIQQIKKMLQGKEYTGGDSAGKIAASGYPIGVADVGLSPVELGIIESEKWSLRRFCNVFGVPSQLLNDPDNKTFNNQKEGEKALTMRCALPQLNSFREHFNRKLRTDWGYKDKNLIIDYDLSVYSELQEDQKEKWSWVRELPVSWKYKLDMMGLDYEGGEEGLEEVMIPTGFQPIDGFSVVDEALNDSNEDSSVEGSNN